MTTTEVETITLGALAMRLGDRVESVTVVKLGSTRHPEVAFGRDSAGLVKRYYSAAMRWNEEVSVWETDGWHLQGGRRFCILLRVRGGNKD